MRKCRIIIIFITVACFAHYLVSSFSFYWATRTSEARVSAGVAILIETKNYEDQNKGNATLLDICCVHKRGESSDHNSKFMRRDDYVKGFLYRQAVKKSLASGSMRKAKRMAAKIDKPIDRSLAYLDIARKYGQIGNQEDQRENIRKALSVSKYIGSADERQQMYSIAADLFYETGQKQAAVTTLQQGLSLNKDKETIFTVGLERDGIRYSVRPMLSGGGGASRIIPRYKPRIFMSYRYMPWTKERPFSERMKYLTDMDLDFYHADIWTRAVQEGEFELAEQLADVKREQNHFALVDVETHMTKVAKQYDLSLGLRIMGGRLNEHACFQLIRDAALYANIAYAYERHNKYPDKAQVFYKKAMDRINLVRDGYKAVCHRPLRGKDAELAKYLDEKQKQMDMVDPI